MRVRRAARATGRSVEVPPGELGQEPPAALAGAGTTRGNLDRRQQPPAQVLAQPRGTVEVQPIPVGRVAVEGRGVSPGREPVACRIFARRRKQGTVGGRRDSAKNLDEQSDAVRPAVVAWLDTGDPLRRRQDLAQRPGEPDPLERPEYPKRLPRSRHDIFGFRDQEARPLLPADPRGSQPIRHPLVARAAVRRVVPADRHPPRPDPSGECRDDLRRVAAEHR